MGKVRLIRDYWKFVKKGTKEWEASVKENKEISITKSDQKAAKIAKKLKLYHEENM